MNAITKFALENNPIKTDAIVAILESLASREDVNVDYIAAVLLGLEPISPELPDVASIYEGKNTARIERYDLLADKVYFCYDDTCTLYFKSEAEAEKYVNGENYYNFDYCYRAKEDYQFPGVKNIVSHGNVSRSEWLEKAVK